MHENKHKFLWPQIVPLLQSCQKEIDQQLQFMKKKGKSTLPRASLTRGGDTQIVSDIHMLVKYTLRYAFLKELQKCLFQPP